MPDQKTGPELMDEVAADPTIDEMLRRDPREVKDADLERLIEAQRAKRAQFISASEKRRAKKAGVEDNEEDE